MDILTYNIIITLPGRDVKYLRAVNVYKKTARGKCICAKLLWGIQGAAAAKTGQKSPTVHTKNCRGSAYLLLSSQKATALAAATFRESTPWYMGIFTV